LKYSNSTILKHTQNFNLFSRQT